MDNIILVDELPLPSYLVQLISQDRWKTPTDQTLLKQLTGFTGKTPIDFLSVKNMIRADLLPHLIANPKMARIYGCASSSRTGQEIIEPGILDVDKAIFIAMNWDEEGICLDYRPSLENPRVVSGILEKNKNCIWWKTIAKDFKSFADDLGL
jgi:hypothetical protein